MRTAISLLLFFALATLPTATCRAQTTLEKSNTDWFRDAGYGVFVHYLAGLQNNREAINSPGRETSWDACVGEFDTEQFAETMKEAGAGYVIFTVMQVSRHMLAPNPTYDRITGYSPGEACSTRDLIADLYQSLHKRNIPLLLYWTGDGPRADPQAAAAFGCRAPVTNEFVKQWADVVADYGERYGDKVAGWWVDGCYRFIGYDDQKLEILAAGLKAVRHELDTGQSRPPLPPGNLAYRKQSKMLSLDGSHELTVNSGVHSTTPRYSPKVLPSLLYARTP